MKQVEYTDQEFFNVINNIFIAGYPEHAIIQVKLRTFFDQNSDYLKYVNIHFNYVTIADSEYYVSLVHNGKPLFVPYKEFPQLFPDKSIEAYNRIAKINDIINGDN